MPTAHPDGAYSVTLLSISPVEEHCLGRGRNTRGGPPGRRGTQTHYVESRELDGNKDGRPMGPCRLSKELRLAKMLGAELVTWGSGFNHRNSNSMISVV